jgi:murein DD-endopeptidase MepM/ murein hydrolase activator NlpD
LKTILNISLALFALIFLSTSALAQTPNDELFPESEPQGENTELLHAGGAPEEEVNSTPLFNEKAVELRLLNVRDSIMHIPAYDTYCTWDTKNLFANRGDISSLGEGVLFELMQSECDFHYPAPGIMTSPFGPRWGRMHYGLDIDLEVGDNVYAAFEGMVRISQYHSSYGNVVVVRHNNGLETLYAHMSQRKVAPGDHVEAGDILGLGGNTGRSYGAHLHFEVRYLGQAFDPRLIVDPSAKQLKTASFTLLSKHFDAQPLAPQVVAARTGSSTSASKSSKSAKSPAKSSKAKYHTIKNGDTLSAIARKNGTTVNALCKLNRIKATSTLRLGQRIRVK